MRMKNDYTLIDETKGDMTLDIAMITYNHGPYIRDAIESVLMQKTNYKYRLLIGDDGSSDGAFDIIKEYQKLFPDRIAIIYCQHNRGDGGAENGELIRKNLRAPYISYLEGDDKWTDARKIEKQISFLESHSEYIGVAGNTKNIGADGRKEHRDFGLYAFQNSHTYSIENVSRREMVSHMSTVTHRNYFRDWTENDFKRYRLCKANGDLKVSALLGVGGITYFSREVYSDHRRIHSGGSYTARMEGKNTTKISINMWNDVFRYISEISDYSFQLIEYKETGKSENPLVYENYKQLNISRMLEIWLLASKAGIKVANILEKRGIRKIVIYGMARLGMCLWDELKNSNITVLYAYDGNKSIALPGLEVLHEPQIPAEGVDAVIVTALTTYDCIKEELLKRGFGEVIALDEILYEMVPDDDIVSGSYIL